MPNDLSILIQAKLDAQQVNTDLSKLLSTLQNKLDKNPLRIQFDNSSLKKLADEIINMQNVLQKSTVTSGLNFSKYPLFTDLNKGIRDATNAQELLNKSLLDGYDLIRSNVKANEDLVKVTQTLKSGDIYRNLTLGINQATGEIVKMNDVLKKTIASGKTFSDTLKRIVEHAAGWAIAGASMMAIFDALHGGLFDVESGMKGLGTVIPALLESQQKFNDATRQFLALMGQYGLQVDEVMQAGKAWGRQYKDVNEVLALVDNSAKLSVVDNLSLEESVKGLEAAMNQFGMTAKNSAEAMAYSGKVMDSWSMLAHHAMVSANDLASGTEAAGAAAKQALVRFDELQGLIAAGVRATGGTGSELANALKMAFGIISSEAPKATKALEALGISMKDANGQMKSAYDILLELSMKTKDATVSQKELSTAIQALAGGRRQYSRLAALLQNFDDVIKNTAISIHSQGATAQMVGAQMDTLARKVKQLQANLIALVNTGASGGLSTSLKSLVDSLNVFLLGLQKVSPAIVNMVAVMGGGVLAWNALSSVIKSTMGMVAGISTAISVLTGVQQVNNAVTQQATVVNRELTASQTAERISLVSSDAALASNTAAKEANTIATNLLTASEERMAATNAIATAGLSLLLGAVGLWIYNAGEANKKQQDLNQSIEEQTAKHLQTISTYKDEINFLDKMSHYYDMIKQKIDSGNLSAQEEAEMKNHLIAVEDSLRIALGDEAYARLKAANFTKQAVDQEKQAINTKTEAEINALNRTIEIQKKQTEAVINGALQRIETLKKETSALNAYLEAEKIATNIASGIYNTGASIYEKVADFADKVGFSGFANYLRNEAQYNRNLAQSRQLDWQNEQEAERQRQIDEENKKIADAYASIANEGNAAMSVFDNLGDSIQHVGDNTSNAADKTNKHSKTISEVEKIIQQYDLILKQLSSDLEGSKARMDLLTEGSKDWIQEANTQIDIMKQQQQTLHAEAEALRALGDQSTDTKLKIEELGIQYVKLQKQIEDLSYQKVIAEVNQYNQALEASKARMNLYTEGTTEYNREAENQINILRKQQEILHNGAEELRSLGNQSDYTKSKIEELGITYVKTAKQIEDLQLKILQGHGKYLDNQIDSFKNAMSTTESTLSNINSVLSDLKNSGADTTKIEEDYNNVLQLGISYTNQYITALQNKINWLQQEAQAANQSAEAQEWLNQQMAQAAIDILQARETLEVNQINNRIRLENIYFENQQNQIEKAKKYWEDYYDSQINAQEEKLRLLEEEWQQEDRLQELNDKNAEINKVMADKRYTYIDQYGNEVRTYNREEVAKLTQERDKLLKEYERDDIKRAINDEIDRLKKAKEEKQKQYDADLQNLKDNHAQELAVLNQDLIDKQMYYNSQIANFQLYSTNMKEYAQQLINDLKSILSTPLPSLNIGSREIDIGGGGGGGGGWDIGGTNDESWWSSNDTLNSGGGDFISAHEGGIIGEQTNTPPKVVSLVNNLLNIKPNEAVVKALRGEIMVPPENIVNNFIPNMKNLITSFTGKGTTTVNNSKTYNIHVDKIQTDDIRQFIKSIDFLVSTQ